MLKKRSLISMDWALKRLLRNKANYEVLEGFLTVLLQFDIKIKSISESEGNQENVHDKFNRVDIKATTTNNETIIIELQVTSQIDYFQRMLYATSKAITEHLDEGEPYKKITKVYSVNIVYFKLGQGNDYVYHGTTEFRGFHNTSEILDLSNTQKETFSSQNVYEVFPEYYILKVNGFDGVAKDSLDEWIYYFKTNEIPDNFSAKGLSKARQILATDNMSEKEYLEYKRHLENKRLGESLLDTAKIEGEQIGVQKGEKIGIEKGMYISYLVVLRNGMSIEVVSKFFNVSFETVAKLKQLLDKYGDEAERHLVKL